MRSRSPSRPSERISTSQSIAHLFGVGQDVHQAIGILIQNGFAEFIEPVAEAIERMGHGDGVFAGDGGPQSRIAGGNSSRVAKAGGSEFPPFAWQLASQECRHEVRQMARRCQSQIVLLGRQLLDDAAETLPEQSGAIRSPRRRCAASAQTTQTRPSNRSARAFSAPCFSEPASG